MSELLRKSAPIHGLRAFRETDDAVEASPESSGPGLAMAGLAFGSPRLPVVPKRSAGQTLSALRRRAAESSPTIRRTIDDAEYPADIDVMTAAKKLRVQFPRHAGALTIKVVSEYLSSPQKMTLADIEADLEKRASSPVTPTVSKSRTMPKPVEQIIANAQSAASESTAASSEPALATKPIVRVANGLYSEVAVWVDALYQAHSPSQEDFVEALTLQQYDEGDLNNPRFVYALQQAVREHVVDAMFLKKTAIKDVPEQDDRMKEFPAYKARWTLRHYTPSGKAKLHGDESDAEPGFASVRSTVSLAVDPPDKSAKKKSGHTGDKDWNKYGNIGNTFFVLCIDGVLASDQQYLKNCKWFAEFDFASIPNLWLSSDWLDEGAIKGDALRGSGEQVKRRLVASLAKKNMHVSMFIRELGTAYSNLEVKVPGGRPAGAWQGPVKYPFSAASTD